METTSIAEPIAPCCVFQQEQETLGVNVAPLVEVDDFATTVYRSLHSVSAAMQRVEAKLEYLIEHRASAGRMQTVGTDKSSGIGQSRAMRNVSSTMATRNVSSMSATIGHGESITMSQHVTTWDEAAEFEVYSKFVGDWVDKTGAFFGGSLIRISLDSWFPVDPPQVAQWTAEFALGECSESEWELFETRANGNQRRFVLTCEAGVDDSLVVGFPASGLSWVLTRQVETTLNRIMTSANIARRLREPTLMSFKMPSWITQRCQDIVRLKAFEIIACVVIFLNAVSIGIEIELQLAGFELSWRIKMAEVCCLAIFIGEIGIRMTAYPERELQSPFRVLDAVLVFVSLVLAILTFANNTSVHSSIARRLLVVRALRLLRLVRVLRVFPLFGPAWRLLWGVVGTASTILSTIGLIFMILYIAACVGIEIITKNEGLVRNRGLINRSFSGIFTTMLTLLQFITEDSISAIYGPLMREEPLLGLYFVPIIFIFTISVMNMVTANIVQAAFTSAHVDKENHKLEQSRQIKHLTPVYKAFFQALDKNHMGRIKSADVEHIESSLIPEELHTHFHMDTMEELFQIIDVGDTGQIDEQQFVDTLLNLRLAELEDTPTELILILKLTRKQTAKLNDMDKMLQRLLTSVKAVVVDIADLNRSLREPWSPGAQYDVIADDSMEGLALPKVRFL